MANFTFGKYNSMSEQVEENKKNIKELCGYIKAAFYTSQTLNTSDTSISISDTNADASTVDGWLFDAIGQLFKITSGDGTNLLIEYYTSLRGEQGVQGNPGTPGADGQNGANGYSLRYYNGLYINNSYNYWTSNLSNTTNLEVGDIVLFANCVIAIITNIAIPNFNVSNNDILEIEATTKGSFIATSQPVTSGDYLTYATSAILNSTANTKFAVGDIINYIDTNDQPTELYEITGFYGADLIVQLKANYAKGKQLYQHNIYLKDTSNNIGVKLTIINDNNDLINTGDKLATYLYGKGYITKEKSLLINGRWATNPETYSGIFATQDSGSYLYICNISNGNLSQMQMSGNFNFEDFIISI